MFKKGIKILWVALLFAQPSIGQIVFKSIENVWAYADEHNVTITLAKMDMQKADISQKQAYSPLLPQVSANGTFTDNTSLQTTLISASLTGGPSDVYRQVKFGQQYIYARNISAQMDILNLQSWFNLRVAKYAKEVSSASLANTRKNMYLQLAINYYSFLLMKEAANLAYENTGITDSVYQSVSNKYSSGLANEVSMNTAKINLEKSQINYTTAQYQMMIASNNLKQLLNLSLKDSLVLDETLNKSPEIQDNAAFHEDPTIRLAMKQMNISRTQYHASQGAFMPTISMSYYAASQKNDTAFNPFSNTTWFPQSYWSFRLTVPLFTGGSRFWQLKKDKITLQESKIQYDAAQKQSALNDENIRLAYQKAAAAYYKAADVMELYKKNYYHATHRYDEGVISIDDKLTAFADYINYQNQYLNTLSDLLAQLYQIKVRQQSF